MFVLVTNFLLRECRKFAARRCPNLSLLVLITFGVGCDYFSGDAQLRVGGPTPYLRCLAGPPPDARSGRAGAVQFELSERTLTLSKSGTLRIGLFSGAGFAAADALAFERLRSSRADMFMFLGGLGDRPQLAEQTLRGLAGLPNLVVTLLGGRDGRAIIRDAAGSAGNIIDATSLRRISIFGHTLIPWAGAEDGRYALDDARCGFGDGDLVQVASELGPAGAQERRYLLSWQTPGLPNAEPAASGSARLRRFFEQIGAAGSISAWPEAESGEPHPPGPLTQLRVPRSYGPRLELADGTREPLDLALLEVDQAGVRVIH